MDGSITIGVGLATDKFDKQVADLERKMSKEEEKKIIIETRLDTQQQELNGARQKVDELADAYQRLNELKQKQANHQATYLDFTEMQELERTFGSLEQIDASIQKAVGKQDLLEQKVAQTTMQYDSLNSKVNEYKSKVESVKLQKQTAEFQKVKDSISGVNSNLGKSLKSIGRMILGIFGIRSAFMWLRSASSQLASYDKQYAANLEYIKFALTQAIAPVLQWIVSLAGKVLQIINSIVNALFGVNLFGKASVNDFKKMKASAGGTAKAAKEIKKQLAGFDEMNVLQDDKSSSGGGGGAGTPDFDLSNLEDAFDFSNFGWKIDELLGKIKERFMQGFTTLGENIKSVLRALGFSEEFIEMFGIAFEGVKDIITGFIEVVRGIFDIIIGLLTGDAELVKRGFAKFIEGIGQILLGLLEFIVGLLGQAISLIKSAIKAWVEWWNENIYKPAFNFIKDLITRAIEAVKNIVDNIKAKLSEVINNIKTAVANIVSNVKTKFAEIKTFVTNVLSSIIAKFKEVGIKIGTTIGGAFKSVVNGVLSAVENILNKPIKAINGMIDKINTLPGVNVGWHLEEFHLPRLAKGTILNAPGKGTLVAGGRAIAGETGREAYLPLSDTQLLEELGSTIGKYITINATIENSMNGRVISRELKRVQNQQDFAFNS